MTRQQMREFLLARAARDQSVMTQLGAGHPVAAVMRADVDAFREIANAVYSAIPIDTPLSPRECDVVRLIADGKCTKEIAAALDITPKTVTSHRTRLMSKLKVCNAAGVTRYAISSGLVQP